VDFIERLRPEQRFAKVAELSAQLARDRDAALAVLESHV
jgi:FAD synthase